MKEAVITPRRRFTRFMYLTVLIVVPTLCFILAMYLLFTGQYSWKDLVLFGSMYLLTGLGISIGYHRLLTHKSFDTHPVIRFFFLALGSMAFQGPAITWSASHKRHHSHSDQEEDFHTPNKGLLHSHFGWILEFSKDMISEVRDDYGKKLTEDKMALFFDRTFLFWSALGLIIPFLIGGWTGLLWGGPVRIFFLSHVTWSVNSICHKYGGRMFETKDQSTNNWLIGLLGFGEGWHNNHHAFPKSAFHGLKWYQIDLSGMLIRMFEATGLVWNVKRVSPEKIEKRRT